jgi:hypothetical protein
MFIESGPEQAAMDIEFIGFTHKVAAYELQAMGAPKSGLESGAMEKWAYASYVRELNNDAVRLMKAGMVSDFTPVRPLHKDKNSGEFHAEQGLVFRFYYGESLNPGETDDMDPISAPSWYKTFAIVSPSVVGAIRSAMQTNRAYTRVKALAESEKSKAKLKANVRAVLETALNEVIDKDS